MAEHGIVSPLFDGNAKAAVGLAWVSAIKALSPSITFVRGSISADARGRVNVPLLRAGLRAFAAAGFEVRGVVEFNLGDRTLNPNALLGYQGDYLKNPWIESQTQRTITLLQRLGNDAPSIIWWGNEPNSQAALNPLGSGRVLPVLEMGGTADPLKPEAMSPQVYFASLYHAAYWIKRECPRVQAVYPAALSCFVAFHTSMQDDWIGNYWARGIQYLTDHELKPPWPWQSISLNLEGLVDLPYAQYIAQGVDTIQRTIGGTGGLVVGEWGTPASSPGKPLNVAAMAVAAQAIDAVAESMSFFSAHVSGGYGIWPMRYASGQIVPGTPTDWETALPPMIQATLAPPQEGLHAPETAIPPK
jgi:hypothetical protein